MYTVVIIEDDPMITRLNRRYVEQDSRFAVVQTFSAAHPALFWLQRNPIDLIILDVYMPQMSGTELLMQLRAKGVDADVIMVTSANDAKTVNDAVRLGAVDYLVKPFAEGEIDALTDELLTRVPQPEKFMELRVEGGEIRLRYRDIIRAEHFAHVIYVHTTAGKTLATRQSFKAFTAPLKEDPRFFVCGRGVIVNLEHAEDFEDAAFRMEDGSCVFVSQELQKSARQSFMEYLLERGRTL